MTFGRPPITSLERTKPGTDNFATIGSSCTRGHAEVKNEFYWQLTELHGILEHILKKVFLSHSGKQSKLSSRSTDETFIHTDVLKTVLEINNSLKSFQASLPCSFKWKSPRPSEAPGIPKDNTMIPLENYVIHTT